MKKSNIKIVVEGGLDLENCNTLEEIQKEITKQLIEIFSNRDTNLVSYKAKIVKPETESELLISMSSMTTQYIEIIL